MIEHQATEVMVATTKIIKIFIIIKTFNKFYPAKINFFNKKSSAKNNSGGNYNILSQLNSADNYLDRGSIVQENLRSRLLNRNIFQDNLINGNNLTSY